MSGLSPNPRLGRASPEEVELAAVNRAPGHALVGPRAALPGAVPAMPGPVSGSMPKSELFVEGELTRAFPNSPGNGSPHPPVRSPRAFLHRLPGSRSSRRLAEHRALASRPVTSAGSSPGRRHAVQTNARPAPSGARPARTSRSGRSSTVRPLAGAADRSSRGFLPSIDGSES